MAEILSFPQLSLDLPSSRMSVDFSKITTSKFENDAWPKSPLTFSNPVGTNLGLNDIRSLPQHAHQGRVSPLAQVKEEPETSDISLSRQGSFKWPWRKPQSERNSDASQLSYPLSRTVSSASTVSVPSTAVSKTFSRSYTASTHTSYTSIQLESRPLPPFPEEAPGLSGLPLSLLEHILSYVFALPRTVSIGPDNVDGRHLQYRYHRAGLDYLNVRDVLKHPLFVVSHHLRDVSLDVLYTKAEFIIDLHSIYHTKVSSTTNENLKRHQKFWLSGTPKMVRNTLQNLSKLHIRLPVPSTEAGARKGREQDEWMDGGDGKGGGNWRVKSMKREQEDAQQILKCLETIISVVMTARSSEPDSQPLTRSLSNLGLRRTKSVRPERSKSAQYIRQDVDDENNGQRRPLKRLEVVLVKRSPWALVLAESLGLIRALRPVPVTGFTRYHFELNGQKYCWATKYRKRWQGREPDGPSLLNDLQGLTIAEPPIEPLRTPTEFKFVKVDRKGQLRLLDSDLPKTSMVLEPPPVVKEDWLPPLPTELSSLIHRKPLPRIGRPRKKVDSFAFIMDEGLTKLGSRGTETSGRVEPPTIEELKKIAEDIKAGLY
ncbi:hypothetical protein BDV96DRAFT_86616 [Lophiotrema nucula]|uniref:F-box domain-containing protein n=1 Tax=Lophiotrema nucula TaxID=690887 RepID=A0A6A5Z6R9_9PLEO|nr:hypothetical protein BDV96DRAFT_86616 [Lophiotrema nucula]